MTSHHNIRSSAVPLPAQIRLATLAAALPLNDSIMVDVSCSWVCETEGQSVSDVLNIHNNDDPNENHQQNRVPEPVLLSQPEDSAPCVLSLSCRSACVIRRLESCPKLELWKFTTRAENTSRLGPFYRKELLLDHPSASCDVKLLSLSGRRCVRVLSVTVALQAAVRSGASVNHSIDLQQVRSMMEEMGTSLSPGAQHLMDMVQFQQQNQTSSLTSLFPMLMGGRALSQIQLTSSVAEASSNQNGAMSHDSSDSTCSESSESRSPVSPAHVTEMMSQLMRGRGQAPDSAPDLLPVLQSVCGHVTQLRLDNAAAALKENFNGTCDLDPEMERRLEQMEQRLKAHFDKRLDALEQKLDSVLNLALTNHSFSRLNSKNLTEEKIHQATTDCD
ncbi:hypothetical protein WMY93_010015 [Mugilogobius chulae]|uniref:Uncharacterized protein n=1 Tax=Mugilogobius chulae TaxID=88201 RepID=A0AAW0PHN4_9GOBI